VVSGGHTQLILMKNHGKYQLLGETRDDAAGEAFDKVAKLLGLGYPGGPIISQRAQKGNPQTFDLPRPMINSKDFDFSFSGLKTAVLYEVKKGEKLSPKYINDMAASFQQAAIDVLVRKTIKAAKTYKTKTVLLSGGVAANQELRQQMTQVIKKELPQVEFQIPDISLCTDNAAMIATAAYYKKKPTSKQSWLRIAADANLKLVD
jgi:N6-L-threonylcarbamoyladenine synthase